MDRIDIKAALERRGWSLRRLSVAHGYRPDSVRRALHARYPNAEWIIAEAIEMQPWEVWPERYPDGPTDRTKVRQHPSRRVSR